MTDEQIVRGMVHWICRANTVEEVHAMSSHNFRCADDLWAAAKEVAAAEGRTVTDVLVAALRRLVAVSLDDEPILRDPPQSRGEPTLQTPPQSHHDRVQLVPPVVAGSSSTGQAPR